MDGDDDLILIAVDWCGQILGPLAEKVWHNTSEKWAHGMAPSHEDEHHFHYMENQKQQLVIQERQLDLDERLGVAKLQLRLDEMKQRAELHREALEEARNTIRQQLEANRGLESYKRQLGMWDSLLSLNPENVLERSKGVSSLNVFLFNADSSEVTENAIRNGVIPYFFKNEFQDITIYHKAEEPPSGSENVAAAIWEPLRHENGLILWVESIPADNAHRVYGHFWIKTNHVETALIRHPFETRYPSDDKTQQSEILARDLKQSILYIADLVAFFADILQPRLPRLLKLYPQGFLDRQEAYPIVQALREQHKILLPLYDTIPDVGADFSLRLARSMLEGKHLVAAREHLTCTAHWLALERDYENEDGTLKDPAPALRKLRATGTGSKGRQLARSFEELLARTGYEMPPPPKAAKSSAQDDKWVGEIL